MLESINGNLTLSLYQPNIKMPKDLIFFPLITQVLLKELEEFAFKGIPDVRGSRTQDAQILEEMVGNISCK